MKKTLVMIMFGLLCFSMISLFALETKAPGLPPVGYWKFDDGSGTVASDSSGNGNTGTLTNGPEWVVGISGTALSFDGLDDYVAIPPSSSLGVGGDQISIEFWMKPTTDLPYSGAIMDIFDKGDSYVGQVLANGKIVIALPISGGARDVFSTTDFWSSRKWYHLAFTYDGNKMRLYVNGVLENTTTATGNVRSAGFQFSIGSHYAGHPPYFKGVLDEFAIYNYSRTQEEIQIDCNRAISDVTWGLGAIGNPPSPYDVTVLCDHYVAAFNFTPGTMTSFIITADNPGTCNMTIPRCRLDGPFTVTINGTLTVFTVEQGSSDSRLSFGYASGTNYVKVNGTERGYIIGDVNGDGQVNIVDITLVAKNFLHKEQDYDP